MHSIIIRSISTWVRAPSFLHLIRRRANRQVTCHKCGTVVHHALQALSQEALIARHEQSTHAVWYCGGIPSRPEQTDVRGLAADVCISRAFKQKVYKVLHSGGDAIQVCVHGAQPVVSRYFGALHAAPMHVQVRTSESETQ